MAANVEVLSLGERRSTFYVNLERKAKKTQLSPTPPMDNDEIRYLLGKCIHLKQYLYRDFAADSFPKPTREGFIRVNASPAHYVGSHVMAILFHENKDYLPDPLGIPIQNYQILYSRLVQFYNEVTQVLKLKPVQNQISKLCGFFAFLLRM